MNNKSRKGAKQQEGGVPSNRLQRDLSMSGE